MPYSVAIAGTTKRTTSCAQALLAHPDFEISFIITPTSKPVGRKQIPTLNPLQKFADSNQIETVTVNKIIDEEVKDKILSYEKPDFILVVDFGYWIPKWLLELPQIMPLNIHPSALPKWRGSSPGQFVLLNGDETSAVSIIQMTSEFDQGPVAWQQEFIVDPSWTQVEYYQYSFNLVTQQLAEVMIKLAQNKLIPIPQPATSPTPLAKKINKQDAFVKWEEFFQAMTTDQNLAMKLERASRAYSPWPLLWTQVPTPKGQRRMQIIKTSLNERGYLTLEIVKIEGMTEKPWHEVKNVVEN